MHIIPSGKPTLPTGQHDRRALAAWLRRDGTLPDFECHIACVKQPEADAPFVESRLALGRAFYDTILEHIEYSVETNTYLTHFEVKLYAHIRQKHCKYIVSYDTSVQILDVF